MIVGEPSVPAKFDCGMRRLALNFAKKIQPGISNSQLKDIAEAMEGSPEAQCRNLSAAITVNPMKDQEAKNRGSSPFNASNRIIVSPNGIDSNPGTLSAPMKTVKAALLRSLKKQISLIQLREGIYRENGTIEITNDHNGLTLEAYGDENPVISGAISLTSLNWTRWHSPTMSSTQEAACDMKVDNISVVRMGHDYKHIPLSNDTTIDDCMRLCCSDSKCLAISFNTARKFCQSGEHCCLLKNFAEVPTHNNFGPNVQTAFKMKELNIWSTIVKENVNLRGLRVNGKRGIRARYPNANPETTLNPDGWISSPTKWSPPLITHKTNPPVEYEVTDPSWIRKDSTGNELGYQAGIGGSCVCMYCMWRTTNLSEEIDQQII